VTIAMRNEALPQGTNRKTTKSPLATSETTVIGRQPASPRTARAIVNGASTPIVMINRNAMPCTQPCHGGIPTSQHRRIDPKPGQHQRHPQQDEQHDRETTRPPAGQLIAYPDGEDHDQQAGDNEGRNLRPTVRPACQRARPRNLLTADEFPAELMQVAEVGPGVQSHRNQEERSRNKPSKHSGTAQRRALHSSVRGAACHEQKAIAMPEASSTAIISAGRQVLQESQRLKAWRT
jgi:hypothetical protein